MQIRKYGSEIEAFATIFGTVVGLGIFALPYMARSVGVAPTVCLIIAVALVVTLLNILFSEVVIFDNREECIVSYANRYLGSWAKKLETFSILFGYTGSLLAYVLAVSVFVQAVIPGEVSYFWPIILFFTGISCLVLLGGLKNLGRIEFLLAGIMGAAFLLVSILSAPHWTAVPTHWDNVIFPYGVVWFALAGGSSIPIAVRILGRERKKILTVIPLAYTVVVIITVLFLVAALRTGGVGVGSDPFITMSQKMGNWVKILGSIIGLLAVVTSHWPMANYLKNILIDDLKIKPLASWSFVVFAPLVLILLGASNFVHVIGLVGLVAGTTDSLILLAIYKKIFSRENTVPRVLPFKLPGAVIWVIFLLLIGAALSSILIS